MKYEQLKFKEALIISYSKDSSTGKMGIKRDYPGFEEVKTEALNRLTEQGFTVELQDIMYLTDDELQEYLK